MIDLTKKKTSSNLSLSEAHRKLVENLGPVVRRLWEGVKRFIYELWAAVKKVAVKAYAFCLREELGYYTAALRVTKKTVARRKLIKKQVTIKQMLMSIEGGVAGG